MTLGARILVCVGPGYVYTVLKNLFADARDGLSSAFASVPNTHFSTFDSRLKSFRQWPHSAAIRPLATPSALASQGFYFAPDDHYKDRVLCAFCNLELAEWGPKDDPIYEHGARAPVCPVVTGKFLSIQTRDPAHLKDIIHEEEANVAKLQVLQMGICLFAIVCERPCARCTPPLPLPPSRPPALPPSLPPSLPPVVCTHACAWKSDGLQALYACISLRYP